MCKHCTEPAKTNIDSGYKELLLLQKIVVRSTQLTFAGSGTLVAVELCLPWVQVAAIHWLSGRRHCALLSLMETVAPALQFTLLPVVWYLWSIVVNVKLRIVKIHEFNVAISSVSMIKSHTIPPHQPEMWLSLCLAQLCCKHQPLCHTVNITKIRVTATVNNLGLVFK